MIEKMGTWQKLARTRQTVCRKKEKLGIIAPLQGTLEQQLNYLLGIEKAIKERKKMATKTSTKQKVNIPQELVRERAYLKWLAETNGEPVQEEDSVQYWLAAEKEIEREIKKRLETRNDNTTRSV